VSFVSLGCPITQLRAEGYALVREHQDADIVIVNTCGFLDGAQQESLAAIGEAMAENGKVIVTGCLGAELEKITAQYPNVLAVTGPQQYESVLAAVHRAVPPRHDAVIPLMAEGKVLPYLDIPFQHASRAVLRRMRRPALQERTLDRITRWREICLDLTIRSTFIVGFPGETEEDFALLLDWLERAQLDRVGCFRYEAVDGAVANELAEPVPEELKQERWHRFMQHQRSISIARLKRKVGRRLKVMIDELGPTGAKGRSEGDAPQIDGVVHVASRRPLRVGEIATVKIERSDAYDLYGTAVGF
jgi:ribosomal protein S12 methylthiotransferase